MLDQLTPLQQLPIEKIAAEKAAATQIPDPHHPAALFWRTSLISPVGNLHHLQEQALPSWLITPLTSSSNPGDNNWA